MSTEVFVVTEHLQGAFTDITFQLIALGRRLAGELGGSVVAGVAGDGVANMAPQLSGADTIVVVDTPALAGFNPEGHALAFSSIIGARGSAVVLVPYTSTGMDIAASVAVAADLPLVSFCQDVRAAGGLQATCQLYGGKIEADVAVAGGRAVFAVLSGAAAASEGRAGGAATIEHAEADLGPLGVAFSSLSQPEAGDVDITTQDVLVVVGRGIESEDNIEEAVAVATALGGAVAASRPVVDQGWLPKSRQVGKSGLTVKPKVYLALGVSGAPEHIEGMRDSSTIIAVNTDPHAPIFGVAHYGWVGDLFDLLPELVDALEA